MSEFEKPLPPVRLAEVHFNDTLQKIAAREMGDANRWPELVWINKLSPPYLTGDERRVTDGVLLYGSLIQIPAPVGIFTSQEKIGAAYERDCLLTNGLLSLDDGGDFAVVSGIANLRQQLKHALDTPRGQATRHPLYGCMVWRLLGTANGPVGAMLGADYVKATLLSDYRVSYVASSVASVSGDVLRITAQAVAIDGSKIDLDTGVLPQTNGVAAGWGNNWGNNWSN
jgi:hypothetical protein